MIRRFIACSLVAAAVLCGCDKKPVASTGSPVVAKAGDEVITVDDLAREVQRRTAKGVAVPEKSVLVQEMLERLAAVSRAKKAGLDSDPETKHEMDNVLIAKLRAQELESKLGSITVTDDELRAAYEAGMAQHTRPGKVRLAILRQKGDAKMSDGRRAQLRARIEEALAKAAASPAEGGRGGAATGFGQVASEYSDDQVSRYRGGDIGWLDEGSFSYHWPKDVLSAGYALEKGKCSGVIEAEGSLYVVMKTDAREGSTTSFDEAKASLRRDLLARKRAAAEAAFLSANRSSTGAEVRTEVLSTVTLPGAPAKSAPVAENTPPALPGMNPLSR